MKNKKIQRNIFKEKREILKKIMYTGFIISALNVDIIKAQTPELKEVKVKVECSGSVSTVNVEQYCVGNGISKYEFVDSATAPKIEVNISRCIHDDNWYPGMNGDWTSSNKYYKNNIYKHTMSDGSVMYSESSSWTHFNKDGQCEGSFKAMDVLNALPEIGISRVDPNLVEYD